jgi:hypothetical protein
LALRQLQQENTRASRETVVKLGLVFLVGIVGCGVGSVDRPAYNAGDYLAAGAVSALDSAAAKKQLTDVLSGVVTSAATSGRDVVLSDKTRAWILDLETALLLEFREELLSAISQSKEEAFRGLDAKIRSAVEAAVTGTSTARSLGAWSDMREQLLGAPLRQDLRIMLSDLDPQLQDMIKRASSNIVLGAQGPVTQDIAVVDQDIQKWKWLALVLFAIVATLIVLHVHAVHALQNAAKSNQS